MFEFTILAVHDPSVLSKFKILQISSERATFNVGTIEKTFFGICPITQASLHSLRYTTKETMPLIACPYKKPRAFLQGCGLAMVAMDIKFGNRHILGKQLIVECVALLCRLGKLNRYASVHLLVELN